MFIIPSGETVNVNWLTHSSMHILTQLILPLLSVWSSQSGYSMSVKDGWHLLQFKLMVREYVYSLHFTYVFVMVSINASQGSCDSHGKLKAIYDHTQRRT